MVKMEMEMEIHKPVLLQEVLEVFNLQPGEVYFDGTVNGGGHAAEILKKVGNKGKIIGFDLDCDLVARMREKYPKTTYQNVELECANYADAKEIFKKRGWQKVNGILLDLGFSSYHIEESQRGFSFRSDEPLDMRYAPDAGGISAYEIINSWKEEKIADILREYGEERFADRIARAIARVRSKKQIATARELANIIEESVPSFYRHAKIHHATRTFQALRIAVNRELDNLLRFLNDASDLLLPGGKLAVISFHSLEDRIVKNFFKQKEKEKVFHIINKKVIRATREESITNPRARSAKLRAAITL